MVGVTGFEPATTWSQTRCATGLRYAPSLFCVAKIYIFFDSTKSILKTLIKKRLVLFYQPLFQYFKNSYYFIFSSPSTKIFTGIYKSPSSPNTNICAVNLSAIIFPVNETRYALLSEIFILTSVDIFISSIGRV